MQTKKISLLSLLPIFLALLFLAGIVYASALSDYQSALNTAKAQYQSALNQAQSQYQSALNTANQNYMNALKSSGTQASTAQVVYADAISQAQATYEAAANSAYQDYLNQRKTNWDRYRAETSLNTSNTSQTTCTLAVSDSSVRYCDGKWTWKGTSQPATNYQIKWYGTKNGTQDENGTSYPSPIDKVDFTWTDGPWASNSVVGNYVRYFKAYDANGQVVCTSNSVNLSIIDCGNISSCHALTFHKGTISPSLVNPSGAYNISCDYGEQIDCISPQAPSGSCHWTGFTGTAANFSCQAGATPGPFSGACKTFATSKNCCSYSNPISLTVSNSVVPPNSSISFSRAPQSSQTSPLKAGDSTTATIQFTPWNNFQGKDWIFKSRTTDISLGTAITTDDNDFTAGWNDIAAQKLCDSNGKCAVNDILQPTQFQCDTNVYDIQKREEWVVVNGVESNRNIFYFQCSSADNPASFFITAAQWLSQKLFAAVNSAVNFALAATQPTVSLQVGSANVSPSHNPPSFSAPANLIISWSISDPTQISRCSTKGKGWNNFKSINGGTSSGGTLNKIPAGTYVYSIACTTKSGGKISDSVTVTVTPSNSVPTVPTVRLQVNNSHYPPSVTAPANLTISLNITNSSLLSNCSGTGYDWNTNTASSFNGTISNVPAGTYAYSITCNKTGGGTISDSVSINVNPFSPGAVSGSAFDQASNSETFARMAVAVAGQQEFNTADQLLHYRVGFASDMAVAFDFAQKLGKIIGKGISGAAVSPEINQIYGSPIRNSIQWLNNNILPYSGISIQAGYVYGFPGYNYNTTWSAVKGTYITCTSGCFGSNPPVSYSNTSIAEAVSPDGKVAKISINNEQGVLNVTLVYNSDGSISVSTSGWLNSQGTISTTDIQAVQNVMTNFAQQRGFAPGARSRTQTIQNETISALYYAAGLFLGTDYNSFKYSDLNHAPFALHLSPGGLDSLYDGVKPYYEGSSPVVGELPEYPEYLSAGQGKTIYSLPNGDVVFATNGALIIIPSGEPNVPGSEEDLLMSSVAAAPSDIFEYCAYLATYNGEMMDILAPFDFDTSLIPPTDTVLIPGTNTYIYKGDFQSISDSIKIIKNLFGPTYGDKLDSYKIFILNDNDYKVAMDAQIVNYKERFGFWLSFIPNSIQNSSIWAKMKDSSGFSNEDNTVFINYDKSLGFTEDVYFTYIHEVAHNIDRIKPFYFQFSSSLAWMNIYDEAKTIGPSAFVTNYAMTNRQEDFADTVTLYMLSGGDVSKVHKIMEVIDPYTKKIVTDTDAGQQLIQKRFDFLKNNGIIK